MKKSVIFITIAILTAVFSGCKHHKNIIYGRITETFYPFRVKIPLEGVTVSIDSLKIETQSDDSGFYYFKNVPPGIYTLTFRKEGYSTRYKFNTLILAEDKESQYLGQTYTVKITDITIKDWDLTYEDDTLRCNIKLTQPYEGLLFIIVLSEKPDVDYTDFIDCYYSWREDSTDNDQVIVSKNTLEKYIYEVDQKTLYVRPYVSWDALCFLKPNGHYYALGFNEKQILEPKKITISKKGIIIND